MINTTHQNHQAKIFNKYHSLDLDNKIYQIKTLNIANNLHLKSNSTILELGSADDSFLNYLCSKTNSKGLGLDLSKGDDLEKPFKINPSSIDLVIALEIIEHIFDTDHFLEQIYKSLKPGGHLILSTPNLASLKNRIRLVFGDYPQFLEYSKQGAGHIHLYTPKALLSQLNSHHFHHPKLTSANFPGPFITNKNTPKLIKEILQKLGDLFPNIGSHLIVLAQK